MKPLMSMIILAGLSAFTIAQDAPEPAAGQTANKASGGTEQSSSKPASPSSTTASPPRPAPRAFKPSEEVRADTVLSLPADI